MSQKKKYRFEFTTEIKNFFGADIPESWEEAKYQMQLENKLCSKDLYLEALIEQQNEKD